MRFLNASRNNALKCKPSALYSAEGLHFSAFIALCSRMGDPERTFINPRAYPRAISRIPSASLLCLGHAYGWEKLVIKIRFWGLWKIVAYSHSYLAGPSCITTCNFWHGVIPTSFFIYILVIIIHPLAYNTKARCACDETHPTTLSLAVNNNIL